MLEELLVLEAELQDAEVAHIGEFLMLSGNAVLRGNVSKWTAGLVFTLTTFHSIRTLCDTFALACADGFDPTAEKNPLSTIDKKRLTYVLIWWWWCVWGGGDQ